MDIAAATYGGDDAGLICGFACRPGLAAQEIGSAEAAKWLAEPPPDGFLWLHFNLAHNTSERWLRQVARLP